MDTGFRVELVPTEENNLQEVSFAMTDKITTIRKTGLQKKLGELSEIEAEGLLVAVARFMKIG
jgi:mRNA-degrading endonuclease toxin of MazEF toxin-antitoxin module